MCNIFVSETVCVCLGGQTQGGTSNMRPSGVGLGRNTGAGGTVREAVVRVHVLRLLFPPFLPLTFDRLAPE